ncbi:MAG: hypothetical protein QM765_43545 [Myxococcales bacterium]
MGPRTILSSLLVMAAAACASAPQVRDRRVSDDSSPTGEQAKPPPNPEQPAAVVEKPFDPKTAAIAAGTIANCEADARTIAKTRGRDMGWAVLRECVNRGFTSIKRITDGFWVDDLLTRKDAAVLLTKIIASRGGDTLNDLTLLNQKRISIFSLAVATEQPKTYMGRLVIARVKVEGSDEKNGPLMLTASETCIANVQSHVPGRTSLYYSDNYGNRREVVEYYHTRNDNEISETGRNLLLRVQKTDPFLAPGREFVVLARFEGVRDSGIVEGDEGKIAILSLVSYFQPSALIIE